MSSIADEDEDGAVAALLLTLFLKSRTGSGSAEDVDEEGAGILFLKLFFRLQSGQRTLGQRPFRVEKSDKIVPDYWVSQSEKCKHTKGSLQTRQMRPESNCP